jgi:large subunit ribosomal protein L2
MGKNLIQQRRGRGSPRYRSPSFKYFGEAKLPLSTHELIAGTIVDLVDCPGHSAPLMVANFQNGEQAIMIAPEGIKVGDQIKSGTNAPIETGNTVALKNIPEGTLIYNVELNPGDGGKFARTSGSFARVISRMEKSVKILMPSRKEKDFHPDCRAQIGIVAGGGRVEKPFIKAGNLYHARRTRNKMYPTVCGVSMNAVDHPYGGKSSHHKGKPTVSPKYAPAGRKVGKLRPRRTGMRR